MASSFVDTLPLTKAESDGDLDFCFLDLALALAAKGEGQVKPNPLVGTVIVKDGVIVGQGFHRYDRVWHAEVLALEQAGRLRKAQRSMSIWNHVATEGMANGPLRARMP